MGTPLFSPENFFTKMPQNGMKWILNTTLKDVTLGTNPNVTFITISFKASLTYYDIMIEF